MKKYRVYLDEVISGTLDVEAETAEEAGGKALRSAEVDWSSESHTSVCDVVEVKGEDGE